MTRLLQLGDRIGVASLGPAQEFEIVGIAKYGDLSSIGGATFTIFDVPTAQDLLDKQGQLDSVQVAAAAGTTPDQVRAAIQSELGSDFTVRTGIEEADEASSEIATFTTIIRYFLLSFAGIALFVGAFVIFNTLSITVAQRMREFATLRTLGAIAAAGAEVRDPRGARDRPRRLHRRPVRRPRARCRAEQALQVAEPRPAANTDSVRDAHRSSSRCSSGRS